mmetsp:Transcript_18973/g.21799  ORF Transcript_18973/g.21799 Transcript_18973/m.21799 type:complete len:293 (-) Transcript_18973:618-1496(-)
MCLFIVFFSLLPLPSCLVSSLSLSSSLPSPSPSPSLSPSPSPLSAPSASSSLSFCMSSSSLLPSSIFKYFVIFLASSSILSSLSSPASRSSWRSSMFCSTSSCTMRTSSLPSTWTGVISSRSTFCTFCTFFSSLSRFWNSSLGSSLQSSTSCIIILGGVSLVTDFILATTFWPTFTSGSSLLSRTLHLYLLPIIWQNAILDATERTKSLALNPGTISVRSSSSMPNMTIDSLKVRSTLSFLKFRILPKTIVFAMSTLSGGVLTLSVISLFDARTVKFLASLINAPCWLTLVT